MNKSYYLKNLLFSLLILFIHLYCAWNESEIFSGLTLFFMVNTVTFPFAKFMIESIVLQFTKREFWEGKFHAKTSEGKALYHFTCFIFSIPLCLVYVLLFLLKLINSPPPKK